MKKSLKIVIIVSIVVIISVFVLWYFSSKYNNELNGEIANNINSIDKFYYDAPKKKYIEIVKEFGNPNVIYNNNNGSAIWYNRGIFKKIELVDESIENINPKKHCEFLYTTINIHIEPELLSRISSLSESIMYDQLKNILIVRSGSMENNVAILYIAMMIISDFENADEHIDLYESIMASPLDQMTYQDMRSKLEELIIKNQVEYDNLNPNKNCTS